MLQHKRGELAKYLYNIFCMLTFTLLSHFLIFCVVALFFKDVVLNDMHDQNAIYYFHQTSASASYACIMNQKDVKFMYGCA